MFKEAGVLVLSKMSLISGCLKGSEAYWLTIKEFSFENSSDIENSFKIRFWGVEKQRKIFLTYGRFEKGSREQQSSARINAVVG